MRFLLERRHIDAGTPRRSRHCPIALAVHEGTGKQVRVTSRTVTIFNGVDMFKDIYCGTVGSPFNLFIRNFDTDKKVTTGTLILGDGEVTFTPDKDTN